MIFKARTPVEPRYARSTGQAVFYEHSLPHTGRGAAWCWGSRKIIKPYFKKSTRHKIELCQNW